MTDKDTKKYKIKNKEAINKTTRNEEILKVGMDRYLQLGEAISVWRKSFFAIILACVFLVGVSTYLFINRSEVQSYIIKVNTDGELVGSEKMTKEVKKVGKVEIEYFAKKFIRDIRTVTKDKNIFNKTMSEVTYFLTEPVKEKLRDKLSTEKINEFMEQKNTREIEILSFVEIPEAEETYQVRWIEKEYDSEGQLFKKKNMNSIIKFKNFSPTEEQMKYNPFGILITDMNITQEN